MAIPKQTPLPLFAQLSPELQEELLRTTNEYTWDTSTRFHTHRSFLIDNIARDNVWHVRSATTKDVFDIKDTYYENLEKAFPSQKDKIAATVGDRRLSRFFLKQIKNKKQNIQVIHDAENQDLAGFIWTGKPLQRNAKVSRSPLYKGDFLNGIYVRNDKQGKSCGHFLWREYYDQISQKFNKAGNYEFYKKAHRKPILATLVSAENEDTIEAFKDMNARVIGQKKTKVFSGDKIDTLVMAWFSLSDLSNGIGNAETMESRGASPEIFLGPKTLEVS